MSLSSILSTRRNIQTKPQEPTSYTGFVNYSDRNGVLHTSPVFAAIDRAGVERAINKHMMTLYHCYEESRAILPQR